MLEATGTDLSRQSFLATLTSGKTFKSNVYPDVRYDKRIRFGASTMHLLEADCSSREWKTAGRFVARPTSRSVRAALSSAPLWRWPSPASSSRKVPGDASRW